MTLTAIWSMFFAYLFCFFKCTATAPTNIQIINFEDDWNYLISPHDEPLLNNSSGNHYFPVYTYEEDLAVEALKEIKELDTLRVPKKVAAVIRSKVSCGVCKLGVGLLDNEIKLGSSFDEIKTKFVSLCVSFNIESELVCTGFFDVFGPELLPAYNASNLNAAQTCGLVFGESCGKNKELQDWVVDLPEKKPSSNSVNLKLPEYGLPNYKVLHLSDTHLDPEYAVGSPSNCQEPLCCRNYSNPSEKEPNIPAGRWGAYHKCDSPKILIDDMLRHIALEHPDVDYIIWTGDLPPHDIWKQTKDSNLNIIRETVKQMLDHFPRTPIFPAVGNHESVPAGSFAPPWMKDDTHSIDWLYTTLMEQWKNWLPSDAENTVLHGGFYSVLLRPGFRLISLNTNYCHYISWWLLVNSTDPAKELKWLVHELHQAELKGEKVHIIGHIPPGGSDCMKVWSKNFYSIIERFKDTVTAQFYGHTHADEFEVFYDTSTFARPTSVAYLGPSVTTYENFNPAYRIYYVDGDHENSTKEVLDHETWTTDLALANEEDNSPHWYKLYSAKDAYLMKSLRPEEWDKLIKNMVANRKIFDLFYKFYYRNSPKTPACDEECKVQILCDLKSGRSHDRHNLCNGLQPNMLSSLSTIMKIKPSIN